VQANNLVFCFFIVRADVSVLPFWLHPHHPVQNMPTSKVTDEIKQSLTQDSLLEILCVGYVLPDLILQSLPPSVHYISNQQNAEWRVTITAADTYEAGDLHLELYW
jgi:hypothetical protein